MPIDLIGTGQIIINNTVPAKAPAGSFLIRPTAGILQVAKTVDTFTQVIRTKLESAATYYIRTDGNDSNDGSANDSAHAWLTVQHAIDIIKALDLNGQTVTVNVDDGTYSGIVTMDNPPLGGGSLVISGNYSSPDSVVLTASAGATFNASNGFKVTLKGCKVNNTGSSNDCANVRADFLAVISLDKVNFGQGSSGAYVAQIAATNLGQVNILSSYTISGGGCGWHMQAAFGGGIFIADGVAITVTGTPNFQTSFGTANTLGFIQFWGAPPVFTGDATGTRYYVAMNACIQTNGGGANFFPGNGAGSTASGGQYA